MDKQKIEAVQEYPEFFTVMLPKYNSQRMHIPNEFVKCLHGRVPKKAILKSSRGKLWHVSIIRNINGDMYFGHGWEKFRKENLEVGYFITFSFDGSNTFSFKIYNTNRCEVMTETHEEDEEDKENNSAEEVEEEHDDDDDDQEGDAEQVINKSRRKRKCSSSKAKQRISLEDYGFDAHMYVLPENPYFATKIGGTRKNELLIPSLIIRDFSFKLQEQIILRKCCKRLPKHEVQEHHRLLHHQRQQHRRSRECESEGKVKKRKDGRMCIKNWASFCRRNVITENDVCLCEFLLGDDGKVDTLVLHIVGI